jgi:hypothetical protein
MVMSTYTCCNRHVRFTPESDIKCDIMECPLWARNGLMRRRKSHVRFRPEPDINQSSPRVIDISAPQLSLPTARYFAGRK